MYYILAKKKKPTVREELQEQHDDNLLFSPRETFANVTTSRRRTPSASSSITAAMEESPRIPRPQDTTCPEKLSENKFASRFELGQILPGYAVKISFIYCLRSFVIIIFLGF